MERPYIPCPVAPSCCPARNAANIAGSIHCACCRLMPGQPASCDIGLPAASAFLALSAAFTIVSLVLLDAAFVARGMCAAAATSSSGIVVRGATLRRFRTVVLPDATANNPTAADSVSSSSVVLSPRAPAEAFAPGADDTPHRTGRRMHVGGRVFAVLADRNLSLGALVNFRERDAPRIPGSKSSGAPEHRGATSCAASCAVLSTEVSSRGFGSCAPTEVLPRC